MLSSDPYSSPYISLEKTKPQTNPATKSASDTVLEKLVANIPTAALARPAPVASTESTTISAANAATVTSVTTSLEQTISESKHNALQMEKVLQYLTPLYEYSSHIEPKVVELVSALRRLSSITENHLHFSPFEAAKITTALWKMSVQQFQQLKSFLVQEYNLRNQLIEKEYMKYLDQSTLLILHQSQQKYFDIFNQIQQLELR